MKYYIVLLLVSSSAWASDFAQSSGAFMWEFSTSLSVEGVQSVPDTSEVQLTPDQRASAQGQISRLALSDLAERIVKAGASPDSFAWIHLNCNIVESLLSSAPAEVRSGNVDVRLFCRADYLSSKSSELALLSDQLRHWTTDVTALQAEDAEGNVLQSLTLNQIELIQGVSFARARITTGAESHQFWFMMERDGTKKAMRLPPQDCEDVLQ